MSDLREKSERIYQDVIFAFSAFRPGSPVIELALMDERQRALSIIEEYAATALTEHQFVCSLLYEKIKAGE